ncbi:hypothetical protein CsSME_00015026 [Camellia sinensis var. sinensis]
MTEQPMTTTTTMMEIKVEVIARETIKPSSPTLHHLKTFKLSLMDQFVPASYTPLVLYYATHGGSSYEERSQLLKNSLSQILTRYYPLAGRIKDPLFVDCNDDGVDYIETRVNCPISSILEQPKSELQNHFIPIQFKESGSGSLLLIQASFFECGGMAIGIYTNHKLADAASFTTFLKAWAATASGFPDVVSPDFTAPSIFPARDDFQTLPPQVYEKPPQKVAVRRYVFNASKLQALKAEAANARVQQPTRVEAVMALLWKCAMDASRSRLGLGSTNPRRPSILVISVDMRERLVPPLPESSFGNIGRPLVVHADDESENEMNLSNLVSSIRESKLELSKNCGVSEICGLLMELGKLQMRGGEVDMYTHTSWSRMPLYEADFGWGKPTWATIGHIEVPNVVVLSPSRDGEGIEAWVTLIEEDMAFFECNKDLLDFATINPSALNSFN